MPGLNLRQKQKNSKPELPAFYPELPSAQIRRWVIAFEHLSKNSSQKREIINSSYKNQAKRNSG
jgi:hypothetical protein